MGEARQMSPLSADQIGQEARSRLSEGLKAASEDILERVLQYAERQGYTRRTTMHRGAWEMSVEGLRRALVSSLVAGSPLEFEPEDRFSEGSAADFAIAEARAHRGRGVPLSMFLGLFKYYRSGFLEAARALASGDAEAEAFGLLVSRFFDRVELGMVEEWIGHGADERLAELQAANRLLTSEKNTYQAAFENAFAPVFIFGPEREIRACNLAGGRLIADTIDRSSGDYGEVCSEALKDCQGDRFSGARTGDVVPWLAEGLEAFVESGEDQRRIEIEQLVAGEPRTLQVAFARMRTASRELGGVVAGITDITPLRAQEREVREGRTMLQRVLDGIGAGILVVDPKDMGIVYCNERAAEIVGRSRKELLGTGAVAVGFLDNHNAPLGLQPLLSKPRTLEDLRLKRPDGAIIPVSMTVLTAPLQGELKIVKVIFDISRQKELERRILNSQKLESIGQLAAGIAHEINTPIQYIGGNVDFFESAFSAYERAVEGLARTLSEEAPGSPPAGEALRRTAGELALFREEIPPALEQTKGGVERVATIVQGIRRFSHPGGNSRRPTDLNKAVHTTIEVARNEWKHVADVDLDLAPDLPMVWCSPGDINQVLLNVVVNAAHAIADKVKHEGGKGSIRIATREDDGAVVVTLADTGMGIKPEHQNKIFDPFFTTKAPGLGTGQGLSIVHAIIEQHQGSITFASTPGEGTTFHIRIPIGEAPPQGDE
ncbi:PAS/PAC sensor signal transduction histidine kinase [Desulfovibrio sp. X2]|uniref:PAS domain-containing sensor histidine kinase n=1 Tax=Desulfovibrio sp. X2 TaxID=941449 RepID=UPI0003587488|nr:ATP-binding protein [Desulfovibrio sp. X2]EPR43793.1 PAS/PAC sensor signal transduction histidine kinase [Desulfovibrio sp. X2]